MNKQQLKSFLDATNASQAMDWDFIKNTYQPEPIEVINGQPVYEFNMILDPTINPIEDPIFLSQVIPGTFVPMHTHQYLELVYVHQGQGTVVLRDSEINIPGGGILIIDKDTPHTVKKTSRSDIIIEMKLKHDYLSARFLSRFTNKSIISQFLVDSLINSRRANRYLYFPFEERSNIVGVMEQIMCECFEKDGFSAEMIDAYLIIMFTELIRYSSHPLVMTQKTSTKQKDTIVLEFLKYIEDHYKNCSLTKMAEHYKYHPNYITAMLKKTTGKSFTELLQIQRLNKAALYLVNSDLSIPDIAEEVGYSSVSFFYKKFNEMFFKTPKEYRANKQ